MFETQVAGLYAEFQSVLAEKGKISPREYLMAIYAFRDKLDRLALPALGVDPAKLATHNIMRFKGYGSGTLMPNSGVRGIIPERLGSRYNPGRILLQRRGDSGVWGLPSGFVNADDSDEATAFIREAREEAGINITDLEMIARTSRLDRCTHTYPNGDRIVGRDNLYRVRAYEGEPNLRRDAEREGLELGFFSISQLPKEFLDMHRYPVELYIIHLETGKFVMG